MNEKNDLFNESVKAGQRTYFVNVREASNGNKYMVITESKRVDKDKFEKSRIMVFQDKLGDFAETFAAACKIAA